MNEQPDEQELWEQQVTQPTLADVAVELPVDAYMGRGTSDGGTMEFDAGPESLERGCDDDQS